MTTRTRHPRSDEASIVDLGARLARPRPVPREDAAVVRAALARPCDAEFARRLRLAMLVEAARAWLGRPVPPVG